jgi:cell division transport system permease protein
MLISAALFWLTEPVNQLAIQYNSGYFLQGLNISEVFQLMTFSCVLGLVGSWISVSRHLKQINPQ